MRRFVPIAVFGVAVAAASPAFCQNVTPRPPVEKAQASYGTPFCECRSAGQVFIQGQSTCLNGQVAVCSMDQNVTTWKPTGQTCPQS
jgi:hypothetical protein